MTYENSCRQLMLNTVEPPSKGHSQCPLQRGCLFLRGFKNVYYIRSVLYNLSFVGLPRSLTITTLPHCIWISLSAITSLLFQCNSLSKRQCIWFKYYEYFLSQHRSADTQCWLTVVCLRVARANKQCKTSWRQNFGRRKKKVISTGFELGAHVAHIYHAVALSTHPLRLEANAKQARTTSLLVPQIVLRNGIITLCQLTCQQCSQLWMKPSCPDQLGLAVSQSLSRFSLLCYSTGLEQTRAFS